jgi:transcriptional regulator with XRE-family HTH domain
MSVSFLKQRRTAFGLTQERLARALGVSQQTIARWEGGGDIPSKYLKDVAVVLDCRVADLIEGGSRREALAEARRQLPADDDESDEPGDGLYGTARIVFRRRSAVATDGPPAGMGETALGSPEDDPYWRPDVREFPVSKRERYRLLYRLADRNETATWFIFETLDNRLTFVNRSQVELFELFGDDLEEAPPAHHEEVYRALSDSRVRKVLEGGRPSIDSAPDEFPYSHRLLRVCLAVAEEWGGPDALEDRMTGVTFETVDGERRHVFSDSNEEAYQELALLAVDLEAWGNRDRAPTEEWMVELGTEQYVRSSLYRLGSLRLIEAPLLAYTKANRLNEDEMPSKQGDNDDGKGATARAT